MLQNRVNPFGEIPEGYGKSIERPKGLKVEVLTPKSIVNTFNAGYVPQIAL